MRIESKMSCRVGAGMMLAIALLAGGCGPGDAACDAYPIAYSGAITGVADDEAFTATFQVSRIDGAIDEAWFNGAWTGTGGSTGVGGSIDFTVACANGNLVAGGWYVESTEPDYPRGKVSGNVGPANGFGTWYCSTGCEGSGTFTATSLESGPAR